MKFANTPIVSTYLICFIVGDFEFVEGKTKEGVDVSILFVCSPSPSLPPSLSFSLDALSLSKLSALFFLFVVLFVTMVDVQIRVYTALDKTDQGTFALDVAIKTLSYYSEYFDIAYPLKKLDMVAIPDFSAGAMENW